MPMFLQERCQGGWQQLQAPMAQRKRFIPANALVRKIKVGEGHSWKPEEDEEGGRGGSRSFAAEYPIEDGHRAPPSRTAAVLERGRSSGKPSRAGREGRASGRRVLPPTELFPACHLSQLGSRLPGVLLAAVGELLEPVLMARHSPSPLCVCQDSSSTCSWLCTPVWPLTQIPATAQGFMPLLKRGKAGERPLGLRGEAETGHPCVPSVLLQQMSAQGGGGGHPGITLGDFLGC